MLSNPLIQKKKPQDLPTRSVKRKLILFNGFIKRNRGVFSVWRQRKFQISQAPNMEIMMTISKIQHDQTEEVINLSFSKISQAHWCIEIYACFQIAVPSGKRYLIAFLSQKQAKKVHNSILQLYNKIETNQQIHSQDELQNIGSALKIKKYNSENNQKTKDSFNRFQQFQFERENEQHQIQFQKSSISCSPYKPESIQDNNLMFPSPLTIEKPLLEDELKYLVSDEGFKLFCNFKEGRFLVKKQEVMKSILLVTSVHSSKNIIERFFHLDLWNNKVSKIKIINRIDQGIYLAYIELKATTFYQRSKYAYLMITVWDLDNSVLLSIRSLEKDYFQRQRCLTPIDFNLLVKIQDGNEGARLMTIILKFDQSQNYKLWLSLMMQLKQFMAFLKSQAQFMHYLREWRKNRELISLQ